MVSTGAGILLAVLIFGAAVLYSSVGHAGASGYLAAMALVGVEPVVMKPTALALNLLVATIAFVSFRRAGCFSWRLFWPFALASVPCAWLGGAIRAPVPAYRVLVGVTLLYAAYRLWRGAAAAEARATSPAPRRVALACGGGIGFLSGLTGVGGGIFLSPILLLKGWADARHTAGVSAAFIWVNSLAGLGGHVAAGGALPGLLPAWAAAAVVGGLIGSYLGSRRLAGPTIRRLLAVVLVVAGLKLLLTPAP